MDSGNILGRASAGNGAVEQIANASAPFVQKIGDTMTGVLTLNYSNPAFQLKKTASGQTNVIYGINGANTRWHIQIGDSAAESGSNVGSDFGVGRYNDAGTFIDQPFVIARSSGLATVLANPTAALGIATKQYVDAAIPSAPWTTGDAKLTLKTTADVGWVLMNDGTIGDASSSATSRANADCQALFTLLWTNITDTYAPVSGGRGASAAADWGAHKTIALTRQCGRALVIQGTGSGLTFRGLGQYVGEESHVQAAGEIAAHSHGHNAAVYSGSQINSDSVDSWIVAVNPGSATINNAGSSTAANVMQPSAVWNIMIKL